MLPFPPGAGDSLGLLPPAGMGNYLTAPFPGLGMGDHLLDLPVILNVTIINSELIRVVASSQCLLSNFRIQELPPYGKAFVLSYEQVSDDTYILTTTPLTPDGPYRLLCDQVVLGELFRIPINVGFLTPPALENPAGEIIAMIRPRTFGLLEALTFAAGKELQAVGGRPTTRVTENFQIGGEYLRVRSTLGFPSSGSLSIDGVKVQYVEKADTAFKLSNYNLVEFAAGDLVVSVTRDIESRSRL